MWTENVTWFSNEVGKKGRIEVGQLADLVVPDRDFFACPESEIADTTALLTMVGGKVVYGAGEFAARTRARRRRPCPTGRRCARFGGYAGWGEQGGPAAAGAMRRMAADCACANDCNVHGHQHATRLDEPAADRRPQELLGRARLRLLGGVMRRVFTAPAVHWLALLFLCAAYLQGGFNKATDFARRHRRDEPFRPVAGRAVGGGRHRRSNSAPR